MPVCRICGKQLKLVTNTHLKHRHGITVAAYIEMFPEAQAGFPAPPCQMDKHDPRYIKWRDSLLCREGTAWNKGYTRETHPSVAKISKTMANKETYNFESWLEERRKAAEHPLERSGDLAELIGIILGDGCLERFPRTERLYVSCNSEAAQFIQHVSKLMESVFHKRPHLRKRRDANCVDINLYQQNISFRLQLPTGNKVANNVAIPAWIKEEPSYLVRCLKGLFETDGCFSEDKANYTCVIEFKSCCQQLLKDTYDALVTLGYHPQGGKDYVRLARKAEVFHFKDLIKFRQWDLPVK